MAQLHVCNILSSKSVSEDSQAQNILNGPYVPVFNAVVEGEFHRNVCCE